MQGTHYPIDPRDQSLPIPAPWIDVVQLQSELYLPICNIYVCIQYIAVQKNATAKIATLILIVQMWFLW